MGSKTYLGHAKRGFIYYLTIYYLQVYCTKTITLTKTFKIDK